MRGRGGEREEARRGVRPYSLRYEGRVDIALWEKKARSKQGWCSVPAEAPPAHKIDGDLEMRLVAI